jgi:hypothetical protein
MPTEFARIFASLRAILQKHADTLSVAADTRDRYALEGGVGPATLAAWGGKLRRLRVPVAWVVIEKSYVSYHLMALDGSQHLHDGMSPGLKARMQGKTCFNFKKHETSLFKELDDLTARGVAAFRRAGFVSD